MDLKEFVKEVILDLDTAVSEANEKTNRDVRFRGVKESRTSLEFDIAVTVSNADKKGMGGGIRVMGIAEGGAKGEREEYSSLVSRISFSLDVSSTTKVEDSNRKNLIFA